MTTYKSLKEQHADILNFCKEYYLTPEDWLSCLNLPVSDGNYSEFGDRFIQIVNDFIRVSCHTEDFDKWSASVEYVFDLTMNEDREVLVDFIIDNKLPFDEETYCVERYNQCQESLL